MPLPNPLEALVLAKVNDNIRRLAANVRLIAFDVDGTLTDGSLWYLDSGESVKRFNILDSHGLRMLKESGILVALLTAREGAVVARYGAELGITETLQGLRDKEQAFLDLAKKYNVPIENTAYMGDDVLDLAALQKAGFAISLPHAPVYMHHVAHWITTKECGNGAVRECCDVILASQGLLGPLLTPKRPLGPVIK